MLGADTPITDLLNLGEVCHEWLARVGIHTKGDLENVGIVRAYAMVRETEPRASIVLLWAMFGALHDMRFDEVLGQIREQLRAELENL